MRPPRAFYRGYHSGSDRRAGQVRRLHVIREHGPGDRVAAYGMCGTSAGPHRNSAPVILDPMPADPPQGLSWCPSCIGHLAEALGMLGSVAAVLAKGETEVAS